MSKDKYKKPNVIFIMTDEQHYKTLGCNGNSLIKTPNLDRLAQNGYVFSNAFVQAPVCVPSRASMLTGRYCHTCRTRHNGNLLPYEENDILKVFKENGYTVGLSGKNHCLSKKRLEELDHTFLLGHREVKETNNKRILEYKERIRQRESNEAKYNSKIKPEDYPTNLAIEDAMEFVAEYQDKPFFLWLSIPEPHQPYRVPEPYASMYQPDDIQLPPINEEEWNSKPLGEKIRYETMKQWDEAELKGTLCTYMGMVTCIDDGVGRLMRKLEELGLNENTIIVYTSDHGDFATEHGLFFKGDMFYDCLVRVPFIFSLPSNLKVNTESGIDNLVEMIDLFPTLMDYTDIKIPMGVQGKSLKPLLEGKITEHKKYVFAEIGEPGRRMTLKSAKERRKLWQSEIKAGKKSTLWHFTTDQGKMVRNKEWKLVCYSSGDNALYDLVNDPFEMNNLYNNKKYQDRVYEMKEALLQWLFETEDTIQGEES